MPRNSLSPSQEARRQRPYRSLYAAILFQGLRDALDGAETPDTPDWGTQQDAPESDFGTRPSRELQPQ